MHAVVALALPAADTVVVPGYLPPAIPVRRSARRCARRRTVVPGSSRCAPAPSPWPPPACWTTWGPPPPAVRRGTRRPRSRREG